MSDPADRVTAYLAEVRQRVDYQTRYEFWENDDLPRLLAAVEAALALHGPGSPLNPAHPNLRYCERCDQPWPCHEHEAITRALFGKEDDDGR